MESLEFLWAVNTAQDVLLEPFSLFPEVSENRTQNRAGEASSAGAGAGIGAILRHTTQRIDYGAGIGAILPCLNTKNLLRNVLRSDIPHILVLNMN